MVGYPDTFYLLFYEYYEFVQTTMFIYKLLTIFSREVVTFGSECVSVVF